MNPNNDAYWADQDNRYGDWDDGGEDNGRGGERQPRNPMDELRRKLELAYATPQSEEDKSKEARAEFLQWAEKVMTLAAEVATKQHFGGRVLKGDGFVELVFGSGKFVRVSDVPEHALIAVQQYHFGYVTKEWRTAQDERDPYLHEPVSYQLDDGWIKADPHETLLRALETGYGPTLAELRADVERLTPGDLIGQSDIAARRDAVREAQERIAALKAKMPAEFASDSWEDTWSPPDR